MDMLSGVSSLSLGFCLSLSMSLFTSNLFGGLVLGFGLSLLGGLLLDLRLGLLMRSCLLMALLLV